MANHLQSVYIVSCQVCILLKLSSLIYHLFLILKNSEHLYISNTVNLISSSKVNLNYFHCFCNIIWSNLLIVIIAILNASLKILPLGNDFHFTTYSSDV